MKLIIYWLLATFALADGTKYCSKNCFRHIKHIVCGNEGSDLDQQLEDAGSKLVVVEFFKSWCPHAQLIAPVVEELAKEYSETIVVLLVDYEKCKNLELEYEITGSPTFLFIKNKEILDRFRGADEDKLASFIQQYA